MTGTIAYQRSTKMFGEMSSAKREKKHRAYLKKANLLMKGAWIEYGKGNPKTADCYAKEAEKFFIAARTYL